MQCKRCGSSLPSEGFICKQCGMLMDTKQIAMQKEYLKENKNNKMTLISEVYGTKNIFQARDTNSNKIWGLIIILVILLIIIGVAIGVYLV